MLKGSHNATKWLVEKRNRNRERKAPSQTTEVIVGNRNEWKKNGKGLDGTMGELSRVDGMRVV